MSRIRPRNGVVAASGVLLAQLLLAGASHAQIENDNCAQAIPITDGTYLGSNVGATDDGDAPGCPSGSASPDVWYLYTATCDGLLEVDTCGSSLDTNLSIQEPGCSGVEVACNEDACGWQSHVTTRVAAGEQLLIRVAGWNGETGPFELHVSCGLPPVVRPARDRCDQAYQLEVPSITVGSTVGAG
jgi:hypothetical protein